MKRALSILALILFGGISVLAQVPADDPGMIKAEKAKEQGEYYTAIDEYDRLIRLHPGDAELVFQKAMCYYRLSEFPTVIRMGKSW